jgi:hypothetical protein
MSAIAVGEQLPSPTRATTRARSIVADLPVGLELYVIVSPHNARDLPPFLGRSFDQQRIKVVDRGAETKPIGVTTRKGAFSTPTAPVPTRFLPLYWMRRAVSVRAATSVDPVRTSERRGDRAPVTSTMSYDRSQAGSAASQRTRVSCARGRPEPDNELDYRLSDTVPERLEVIFTLRHVI